MRIFLNPLTAIILACIERVMSSVGWKFFSEYFALLFSITVPFVVISLFIGMTASFTHKERITTAKIASATAYFTMVFFALIGQKFFEIFGIGVGAFRIGGGIFIVVVGLSMLMSETIKSKDANQANEEINGNKLGFAVTPIGIPLICGPGCITTIIAKQTEVTGVDGMMCGVLIITIYMALFYALLLVSAKSTKWLTPMVLELSCKLSGLLVVALGIQMIIGGLRSPDIAILSSIVAR